MTRLASRSPSLAHQQQAASKAVPIHSARVELGKSVIKDNSILGSAYKEMLHNISERCLIHF